MSKFRKIYPPSESVFFDGGLNNKFQRSIIEDNESPDCANVVFMNGAVETRQGVAKLNTAAVGSFVCDGLYTRHDNTAGGETMIAFFGGSAWQLGGTSFTTIASAQSVFTAGVRVGAAQMENNIFVGNGGVIPYKKNATDWTRHGVYPPTTTSTIATAPTGANLTGSYSYKVTYVNTALVESDVGPVTNTLTVATQDIRITSIPVAPQSFGISARRLYRTTNGGAVYKRLVTISDNTTTTYDDAIADASLGTNAPTDNGVPPKYSVIVYHQSRLFMNDSTDLSKVWYTNLNEPYTVASTNFIIVGDNSTDLVKGLAVHDNALIVFCETSVWLVYMPDTDPTNWVIVKAKSAFGSWSPYGYAQYNDKVLFPAMQSNKFVGYGALAGDTIEPSASILSIQSVGSSLKTDRIEPDMFDVQEAYVGNISSITYKNRVYSAVTFDSPNTTNNRVYVMDFSISNLTKNQREAWVPWTGINAAQFTVYNQLLYYGTSTATGFVYKMESGVYSDDGTAIDSYYWTKEFPGYKSDTNFSKDFRYANILVDNYGDWNMGLTYRTDSDTGVGNTVDISLNPGGSLWGSMIWGISMWGGGTDQKDVRQYLDISRGKRIQFKFSNKNTVGSRFRVSRLNFVYNLKGYR